MVAQRTSGIRCIATHRLVDLEHHKLRESLGDELLFQSVSIFRLLLILCKPCRLTVHMEFGMTCRWSILYYISRNLWTWN